jgi:hypothetical protein
MIFCRYCEKEGHEYPGRKPRAVTLINIRIKTIARLEKNGLKALDKTLFIELVNLL